MKKIKKFKKDREEWSGKQNLPAKGKKKKKSLRFDEKYSKKTNKFYYEEE